MEENSGIPQSNTMKIRCLECGKEQDAHKRDANTTVICVNCKRRIIALPMEKQDNKPKENELPGAMLAKIWILIGIIALLGGFFSLLLGMVPGGRESSMYLFFWRKCHNLEYNPVFHCGNNTSNQCEHNGSKKVAEGTMRIRVVLTSC